MFPEFIRIYWEECRAVCPQLVALSGKWEFEDLIPGLSDFDTRLVFDADLSPTDWAEASMAIGRVHSCLARREPSWARILEHLPGINLTLEEMLSPRCFYPEFQQWNFYQGDAGAIRKITSHLSNARWSEVDESYHLRRLAAFFGPYQRGIDPPVNVGLWENKYPLHSRFLHYFTPAVQSAVSLALRRTVRGKLEALRLAQELFPDPATPRLVLAAIERHFEIEDYYGDDRLLELETMLDRYLRGAGAALASSLQLIRWDSGESPETLRAKVRQIRPTPEGAFYDVFKFCRLMKGRLLFYAIDLPWFETTWLIHNELGRLRRWFYEECFARYAEARLGAPLSAEQTVARLEGGLLSLTEAAGTRAFAAIAGMPIEAGREKERAREVAACFEPVHCALEKMWREIRTG